MAVMRGYVRNQEIYETILEQKLDNLRCATLTKQLVSREEQNDEIEAHGIYEYRGKDFFFRRNEHASLAFDVFGGDMDAYMRFDDQSDEKKNRLF